MEFTKLVKYGTASLFLVLVAHGLILGFNNSTTVLSVVLVAVTYLLESRLLKSERADYEQEIKTIVSDFRQQVKKLSEAHEQDKVSLMQQQATDKDELLKKLDNTHSQISSLKLTNGIRKL